MQDSSAKVLNLQPPKLILINSPTKPSATSQKLSALKANQFEDYSGGKKKSSTHRYVDDSSSAGNSPDRPQNHTCDKPNEY